MSSKSLGWKPKGQTGKWSKTNDMTAEFSLAIRIKEPFNVRPRLAG